MDAAERDDLRRLAGSATAGPWREYESLDKRGATWHVGQPGIGRYARLFRVFQPMDGKTTTNAANARFIAAANPSTVLSLIAEIRELREALTWIRQIADSNLEQDEKLRAQGARTLKRIADHCDEALNRARKATHSNGDVK